MRVPLSWLREYVDLPPEVSAKALADRLTFLGLKLEALESPGADVAGPLVIGRVLDLEEEQHSNGKTVRWCHVEVGEAEPRGVVCGALNFEVGDLVVVALPGSVLPGGFEITPRKTYGHVSDGMICSARELGLGEEHTGILVLAVGEGAPGDAAAEVLQLRDDVIELEINQDRAYALSLRGVAREAAIAYGLDFHDPAIAYGLDFHDPATLLPAATAGDGYPVRVLDVATAVTPSSPCRSTGSTRHAGLPGGCRGASSSPACGRSPSPSTSRTTSCSSWAIPSTATTATPCGARSSYDVRSRRRR